MWTGRLECSRNEKGCKMLVMGKWRDHNCKFEAMPVAFLSVLEEVLVNEKAQTRTGVFDFLPSAGVVFTSQLQPHDSLMYFSLKEQLLLL